jgi:hypothetical protein
MYSVTVGGRIYSNLAFLEAMQKIQRAFENGKDAATLERQ